MIGTSRAIMTEAGGRKSSTRVLRTEAEARPSGPGNAPQRRSTACSVNRPRPASHPAMRSEHWRRRSETWRRLMVAAQSGESRAYDTLLRELDVWLRGYYARRLPGAAADDARQEALLAIHAQRQAYVPSRPFGPWVAAIARYKWIDHVRDASRFAAVPLDHDVPIEDGGEAPMSAIALDRLLNQLKPAQSHVIRLVKLQGVSIKDASDATGQSAALVKVNIHRGLKKLAALITCDDRPAGESARRRSSVRAGR